VIHGRWKYIWSLPGGRRELYDRSRDRREGRNVYGDHREVAADLHQRLLDFEESAPVYERSFATLTELDTGLVEELRTLGYVE
jgi:hypothetical protein